MIVCSSKLKPILLALIVLFLIANSSKAANNNNNNNDEEDEMQSDGADDGSGQSSSEDNNTSDSNFELSTMKNFEYASSTPGMRDNNNNNGETDSDSVTNDADSLSSNNDNSGNNNNVDDENDDSMTDDTELGLSDKLDPVRDELMKPDKIVSPLEQSTVEPISYESTRSKLLTIISKPGILAGIVGGAIIGILTAILLIMFIVYRMRKKDEGSYALEDSKKPLSAYDYRHCPTKEFYA